jgi:hypothetical protein
MVRTLLRLTVTVAMSTLFRRVVVCCSRGAWPNDRHSERTMYVQLAKGMGRWHKQVCTHRVGLARHGGLGRQKTQLVRLDCNGNLDNCNLEFGQQKGGRKG